MTLLKEQNKRTTKKSPGHSKSYGVAPTPHNLEQDFFYYVNKEDEDEAFESLGYNPRCMNNTQEDDFRVNKFW